MPSTFSDLLRVELMANGENDNTWGTKTNTNLQLLERAIAKRTAVVLASSDYTLTTANGADDEARALLLDLSGTLSANVNVIVPNKSKMYLVRNGTTGGFTVTIKTSAGTGVAVPQGRLSLVCIDGVGSGGAVSLLSGVSATSDRNAWTAGNREPYVTVTDAATGIINTALGNVFKWTLGGNRTVQIDNPLDGSWIELYVKQDATGSRTLTWPGNIVWSGGATPVLSTAPNAVDRIFLRYDASLTTYYGVATLNLSTGTGGALADIVISSNCSDLDIFRMAGSPAGAVTLTVRVARGVVVRSSSAATVAMDFQGFAATSTISLVNLGNIQGHGGKGGRGGAAGDANSANLFFAATDGSPGGDAIRMPAAATTFSITNVDGRIWGGGGGGGGGGPTHNGDGTDVASTGGGGGGGAGGGIPGDGGSMDAAAGNPGVAGGAGYNGDFGAGGTGETTGGTGTAATGGAGGTWGADGNAGVSQIGGTFDAPAGDAGVAGKAINVNGGTAPTFVSGSGSPNVMGAVS